MKFIFMKDTKKEDTIKAYKITSEIQTVCLNSRTEQPVKL